MCWFVYEKNVFLWFRRYLDYVCMCDLMEAVGREGGVREIGFSRVEKNYVVFNPIMKPNHI